MCSPCLCCHLHRLGSFLQAFAHRTVLVALFPFSPTSSIPPACFCSRPLCFLDLSAFPFPGQQLLVAGAHEIHVGTPVELPVCFQDCFASWPGQLNSLHTPQLFPQDSCWLHPSLLPSCPVKIQLPFPLPWDFPTISFHPVS